MSQNHLGDAAALIFHSKQVKHPGGCQSAVCCHQSYFFSEIHFQNMLQNLSVDANRFFFFLKLPELNALLRILLY